MFNSFAKPAVLAAMFGATALSAEAATLDTVTAVTGGPEVTHVSDTTIQALTSGGLLAGMTGGPVQTSSGSTPIFNYSTGDNSFMMIIPPTGVPPMPTFYLGGTLVDSDVSGSTITALFLTNSIFNRDSFADYLLLTVTGESDFVDGVGQTITSFRMVGAEEISAIPVPPAMLALLTAIGALGFAGRRNSRAEA